MHSETMILVRDVEKSSAWYQQLLGAKNDHGGPEFDRIVDSNRVLLRLHRLDTDEYPGVMDPRQGIPGRGVLMYFCVQDIDRVYRRAIDMKAHVLDDPHFNEKARQREFSLRDPDGYALIICETSS